MCMTHEAEYEIVERRHGRIRIKVFLPDSRQPIQHGVPVKQAKKHPDGVQGAIEEAVERIAARHSDPEDDNLLDQCDDSGKVEFEPGKEPPGRAEAPPSQRPDAGTESGGDKGGAEQLQEMGGDDPQ